MNKTQKIESMMEVVRILVGLVIAYAVALAILFAISEDPIYIVQQFVLGPFSSPRRIGTIINLAIPFTICGLSMCFMYAVNKFNLVGEGIFMLSACMVVRILTTSKSESPVIAAIWTIRRVQLQSWILSRKDARNSLCAT